MRLIIVSGLSGSGKSVALHLLEDIHFYCVDTIPAALWKPFTSHTIRGTADVSSRTAVGLDARNGPNETETIPALVSEPQRSGYQRVLAPRLRVALQQHLIGGDADFVFD